MGETSTNEQAADFAGFTLDYERGSLSRAGEVVKLRPKSFELDGLTASAVPTENAN